MPRRYYINFALDALSEDDMDEAVRCLELARRGAKSSRWRLVAQQVVFRLRVLKNVHLREHEWLNERIEKEEDPEFAERLEKIAHAQMNAVAVLSGYEERLLNLLKGGPAA
jgi:hypothetical protein